MATKTNKIEITINDKKVSVVKIIDVVPFFVVSSFRQFLYTLNCVFVALSPKVAGFATVVASSVPKVASKGWRLLRLSLRLNRR